LVDVDIVLCGVWRVESLHTTPPPLEIKNNNVGSGVWNESLGQKSGSLAV